MPRHVQGDPSKLADLKNLAAKLSIKIQYDRLFDNEFSFQSGHCRLEGKDLIILDQGLSDAEQVAVILQALGKFDLENIFFAPWIREYLESPAPADNRSSMPGPP
ncbi:MAG: hypothetical protein VYC17_03810 [Nitrospinota bacterium]|nr:hypothetical protein [Nitrospinota bacterium]